MITTDVLDYEEAAYYGSIDNYGDSSDEEEDSSSLEAGVKTGVTKSGTEEAEEVKRGCEIFFYFVLYVETSFLTNTGI